jgi:cell division protein FtsB
MKIYSKQFIILLVVIFVFAFISLGKESYRYFRIVQEVKDLEKKIGDIKTSNEELIKTREFYQSEEFLEQEAKKKLGYAKEGESVIIIASNQEQELEPQTQTQPSPEASNFKLWWDYFFKNK